jgi:hypothetical protein
MGRRRRTGRYSPSRRRRMGSKLDGEGCWRVGDRREGRWGPGKGAWSGGWQWVARKGPGSEADGGNGEGMDGGGLPAPNERREGVSTWGKSRRGVGTHLCPWGPPRPSPRSTMDKSNEDVIYDVPIVPVVGFVVPTGPAVELREGGGTDGCGGDISTTPPPLTTQSP